MIKGRKKEQVRTLQYFDVALFPAHFHYWELSPILSVEEDPKYDEAYFNFGGYLDTLAAPFLLSQEIHVDSVNTKNSHTEYFHKHFPNNEMYGEAINQYLEEAYKHIEFEIPLKDIWETIMQSLDENLKNLCEISIKLSFINQGDYHKYAGAGLMVVKKLIDFIVKCNTKLQLLDKDIYDNHYYVSLKNVSWNKDPLAYFKYFFLNQGYKKILEAYSIYGEYTIGYYDDISNEREEIETIHSFIHRSLILQYAKSFTIIKQLIEAEKKKAQPYITKLLKETKLLHDIARDCEIKKYYKTPHRPLCHLIKKLEDTFSMYDWSIDLDFDCIPDHFIYRKKFLIRLRDAKVIHDVNGEIKLFTPPVSLTYLEWFTRGAWENTSYLNFNWDTTQVYFLLSLLEKHSRNEINYASKNAKNKFSIQGDLFDNRNYATKKNQVVPNTRWWKSQILNLFKQH